MKKNIRPDQIAVFISPHGFGHAARASAVMEAWKSKNNWIHFNIFTTIPRWFFQDSLSEPFDYFSQLTDIGLVQETPFHADLEETIRHLDRFLPFHPEITTEFADKLTAARCALVICDIAPLGIAIARQAGIPSVLIENFTWDWIYEEYNETHPGLTEHIRYLRAVFNTADFHIQTEPVCARGPVDLTVMPISRKFKTPRYHIRKQLNLPPDSKMVLITTGGIKEQLKFLNKLKQLQDICFVIPGGGETFRRDKNVILLPHQSDFFHPDLVNASDAVVGKAGYSTIAEVYHANVPFGYVSRPAFRETHKLEAFIQREMTGLLVESPEFQNGGWISKVEALLSLTPPEKNMLNEADRVADYLDNVLRHHRSKAT
ncbi:MAG: hypothetical protein R6X10_08415 [Desulfobacterales bacterium]